MSLDGLDLKLMQELEADARQPVQVLAEKLGIKRTTIGYRLNRLINSGIVKFACVCNSDLLGYQFFLLIGINSFPGQASSVTNQLAAVSAIKAISLTAGRYNIMVWALLRDCSTLSRFVSETLAGITEIHSIEIINSYQWIIDSWSYFNSKSVAPKVENQLYSLDDLDRSIIRTLQDDPRQSITKLAETAGCSTLTAKTQLEKLLSLGVIRIVSIVDSTALGYDIRIMIMIRAKPEHIFSIADLISTHTNARHVSLTTGRWQVNVEAEFMDNEHMNDYLSETLNLIPGILEYEVIHIIKNVKLSPSFLE